MDNEVQPVRGTGQNFLGQDQDSLGGGFNDRQSWSGTMTQFNIWGFPLEDYSIENANECRSDILGDIMEWTQDYWILSDVSFWLQTGKISCSIFGSPAPI